MKNLTFLLLASFLVFSCGGNSNQKSTASELTDLAHYLVVKDALVATDATKAKVAAENFLKELTNTELAEPLKQIVATSNVEIQREAFDVLSKVMYKTIKATRPDITIYHQYCPMAFDNEGAYWLSKEEKVMNPYFGSVMLNCGRVEETIRVL